MDAKQADVGDKPKSKRSPKKSGLSNLLRKMAEATAEFAQFAERAEQMMRQETFRTKKNKERLRIVLQSSTGVCDILKRVNLEPTDREFLISEGYIRDRKDR